jgi:RNA polymerase sigma-70 factor, ECF subfamily
MSEGLDRPGLEALYARLEKPLFNVVFRWLWDVEDSRDVVQETFVRLWDGRARVRVETVEPLLYRMAVNLAANRRRARKVRQWLTLEPLFERPAPDVSADEGLMAHQRQRAIRSAIDALPEALRRVVVLRELADLSYEQIADALSIPAGTVASRRNAAMKLLARALQDLGGTDLDDAA